MSNPLFRQLLSVKSPVHHLALLLTLEQARNLPPSWAWHEAFSMQCLSLGHLPAGLDVPPSDPCSDATLSVRPFLYVLVRMPLSLGGLSCSSWLKPEHSCPWSLLYFSPKHCHHSKYHACSSFIYFHNISFTRAGSALFTPSPWNIPGAS